MVDWECRESQSRGGKLYYFNPRTGETQWNKPDGFDSSSSSSSSSSKKRDPTSSSTSSSTTKRPRKEDRDDDGKKVRAYHILCKHAKSRRASSWREDVVTRTKAEALERLGGFRERLDEATAQGGQAEFEKVFKAIATQESDCSSAARGGDLGSFGRNKMQRAFEEGAFGLEVDGWTREGQEVDSDSGVHLIWRAE